MSYFSFALAARNATNVPNNGLRISMTPQQPLSRVRNLAMSGNQSSGTERASVGLSTYRAEEWPRRDPPGILVQVLNPFRTDFRTQISIQRELKGLDSSSTGAIVFTKTQLSSPQLKTHRCTGPKQINLNRQQQISSHGQIARCATSGDMKEDHQHALPKYQKANGRKQTP